MHAILRCLRTYALRQRTESQSEANRRCKRYRGAHGAPRGGRRRRARVGTGGRGSGRVAPPTPHAHAARGAGRRLGPQFLKVSNAVRTPAAPSGPYANGAMDDAFSSMVASQAKACAPRPAKLKATPSDDSLHATDLDAAKMLGSYAFNAVRGIAMFRRKKK